MKNQNKVPIKYYLSHNTNSMPNHKPKRIRHTEVYEEQNTDTININDIITILFNCLSYLLNVFSVILFYRYISLGYDVKNLRIGIICCAVASIIKILNNKEDEVDE